MDEVALFSHKKDFLVINAQFHKKKQENLGKKRLEMFVLVSGLQKYVMANSSYAVVCQEETRRLGKISHDLGASQVGW